MNTRDHQFAAQPVCLPGRRTGATASPREGTRRRAVAGIAVALTLALGLAAGHARAGDRPGDDDQEADGRYCTATAKLMHTACGFETKDDYFVGKAKCINVGDARERRACLSELRQAKTEADNECRQVFDARRALCAKVGEGRYDPPFVPENFDTDFRNPSRPNPYYPLGIGHRWEYAGGDERGVVQVLDETKLVAGVTCIVVRDEVYVGGVLREATDDWFGVGRNGSSWYCGEEVKDYEVFEGDRPQRPQLTSIDGSFKHGTSRDKAGMILPGQLYNGLVYREEFSLGNAEDVAEVLEVAYAWGRNAELDRGVPRDLAQRLCNSDCVVTRNGSPTEPGVYALKYYARGIGFFLETKPDVGTALQLVNCNFDSRCTALPTSR